MSLLRRARDLLFPRKCAACGELLDWYDAPPVHDALCSSCLAEWEQAQGEVCGVCAKPLTDCTCMSEVMEKAKCISYRKLVYYRHTMPDAVQNRLIFYMKRVRDAEAPLFLAERLLPALEELRRESDPSDLLLTYIPRGKTAKLEYGTDQAEQLARALSRFSGVPVKTLLLRNRGKNAQQKTLSATARIQNARESFRISPKVALTGKTVILIDDIVTTGASMAAGTRLLRRAGAKRVYCMSVASNDINCDRI